MLDIFYQCFLVNFFGYFLVFESDLQAKSFGQHYTPSLRSWAHGWPTSCCFSVNLICGSSHKKRTIVRNKDPLLCFQHELFLCLFEKNRKNNKLLFVSDTPNRKVCLPIVLFNPLFLHNEGVASFQKWNSLAAFVCLTFFRMKIKTFSKCLLYLFWSVLMLKFPNRNYGAS